jgi:hypothetical protein
MNDNTIEVTFIHPRRSEKTLVADISPQCTGQEALEELMRDTDGNGAFLPPLQEGNYHLSVQRTEQDISPNMTFAQAGVVNGDSIAVGQSMIGAISPAGLHPAPCA